jgi:hypothetical protein
VQPIEAVAPELGLGGDLLLEVLQDEEEADEHRELRQDRQAGCRWVDLVLLVEGHHLRVHPLAVVLPALLDGLHLGRMRLQVLHRVDLADGQRHEHDPHDHDERDDRPGPRETERVVEVGEDPRQQVLEGREDAREDHA